MQNTMKCSVCAQNHVVPMGKGSLLEISEMLVLHTEGMRELPECHEKLLREKLHSTIQWMMKLPNGQWTKEKVKNLLLTYRTQVLDAHRDHSGEDVSDIQVSCDARDLNRAKSDEQKADEELSAFLEEMDESESIVTKSMGRPEAKMWWFDSRISGLEDKLKVLKQQLSLDDRIQDGIDLLEKEFSPKRAIAYAARIDELYREKKIRYNSWLTFSNQVIDLVNEKGGIWEPRLPGKFGPGLSTADMISSVEKQIFILKVKRGLDWNTMNPANHPDLVAGMKLDAEDDQSLTAMWQG